MEPLYEQLDKAGPLGDTVLLRNMFYVFFP